MKNGTCSKCNSTHIYFKPYALTEVRVDGKQVEYTTYICTDCGFFETYITDKEALSKIPVRAEKLGDWKKAS
jgi:RNase P subunit RPR2